MKVCHLCGNGSVTVAQVLGQRGGLWEERLRSGLTDFFQGVDEIIDKLQGSFRGL